MSAKTPSGFMRLYWKLAANDFAVNLVGGLVAVLFLYLMELFDWRGASSFFWLGLLFVAPFYLIHLGRMYRLAKHSYLDTDSFRRLDLRQRMDVFHRFASFPSGAARAIPYIWLIGGLFTAGYARFAAEGSWLVTVLAFLTLVIMAPIGALVTAIVLRRLVLKHLRGLMQHLPESSLVSFSFYRMSSFTRSVVSVFYMTLIAIFFVSQAIFFTGARLLRDRLTEAATRQAAWVAHRLAEEAEAADSLRQAWDQMWADTDVRLTPWIWLDLADHTKLGAMPEADAAGFIVVTKDIPGVGVLHVAVDSGRDDYLWEVVRKGGLMFLLLMVGVGAVVLFQVGRDYRSTVRLLHQEAESVAKGDLTRSTGLHATDEFWEIYRNIVEIKHHTARILMEIRDTSKALVGTTQTVESASRFLKDLAADSARTLQNVSDALAFVDGFGEEVKDSISVLARSAETTSSTVVQFATAVNQIKASMARLVQLAEQVNRWVRESGTRLVELNLNLKGVADFTRRVQESSESQASYYQELEQAVDQLRGVSQRAIQHSEQDTELVRRVQEGADELEGMLTVFREIRSESGREIEEIRQIVDLVDDFVDQAQILALNAAIIAAKTETRDSGFGVIAEEIRNLAMATESSTVRVRGIVENVAKQSRLMESETRNAPTVLADMRELVSRQLRHIESFHQDVTLHGKLVEDISGKTQRQNQLLREVVEGTRSAHQQLVVVTDALGQESKYQETMARTADDMRETAEQVLAATQEQTAGANHIAGESERIRDLAMASEQTVTKLKETLSELVETVTDLGKTGDDMTERAGELSTVVQELSSQTRKLTEEINRFQLPRHAHDE